MTKRSLKISIMIVFIFMSCLTLLLIRICLKPTIYYASLLERPVCGVVSVVNICLLKGIETNFDDTLKYIGQVDRGGVSLLKCKYALEQFGIGCRAVSSKSVADLPEKVPMICVVHSKKGLHSVVLLRRGEKALLIDGRRIRRFDVTKVDRFFANVALVMD